MTDSMLVIDCGDGSTTERPLTPEEQAERDASAAAHGTQQGAKAFAVAEDAERLAVIAERAALDPAYAALADIVLGTKGVQT